MAAPTTAFTDNSTGRITTTGETNGLLLQTGKGMNRVTFGFRGTFTSVVVAVQGHLTGQDADSYFPIPGVYTGSGLPISNPKSVSLTNSTNAALTFDTTGCDYVEVWVVSGTPTTFYVDAVQFQTTADTPPLIVQAQTSATTISANETFTDSTVLYFGTGNDVGIAWSGTALDVTQAAPNSSINWGISGAGIDHVFYGDTATYDMTWDQSADSLVFNDNAKLAIGTGADITHSWDGTRYNVNQLTANSEIRWGVDGAGIDQRWYGDTASASLLWDQSLDALVFNGAASARGLRTSSTTAAAITGATTLTLADSGGVFNIDQDAAFDIDLPSPTTGAGCTYTFVITDAGANNVTITVDGGAATFVGTIVNDVTSVVPATGSTLTFASGTAAVGDNIVITSLTTGLYLVRAVSSAAGGITVA